MKETTRKMWETPWGYGESIAAVCGLAGVGILLQVVTGGITYAYLQWPVNLFIGCIIILLITGMSLYRRSSFFRWLSGVPLSVTLICALTVMGIVMGLVPQVHGGMGVMYGTVGRLGLLTVTSSWPFAIVYLAALICLGCVIVRRAAVFRWDDYAFYLNHTGLWLLLFSAGLGAADIQRHVMYIRQGEVEWRVYDDHGSVMELPVAIQLNSFDIEEYAPRLAVIERSTGTIQPEGKPAYFQPDEGRTGVIGPWEFTPQEYIHHAVRNSDSTYHDVRMPGASPAAKVKVTDSRTGNTVSGWVCSGNSAQLYMVLNIDDDHCVVMTQPEPKRFLSDIDVFTEDGRSIHAILEVNKPLRVGKWTLYQYGYDREVGRMSAYSSIELVYDPWVVPAYAGIALLAAGSVCMLWSGTKRRRKEDDMG